MSDNNNSGLISSPAKAEQIIEYCRQKFINILPNNNSPNNRKPEAASSNNEIPKGPNITSINVNYKK